MKPCCFPGQAGDVIVGRLGTCTEEGKKVQRNGGKNFLAVFRRIEDPNWNPMASAEFS